MKTNHIGCTYLKPVTTIDNWKKTITRLVKEIKASGLKFDSIAFSGMSGALVSPTVAGRLNKTILMVRKDKDDTHSGCLLEGNPNTQSYIIVDDLVASGGTINKIIDTIKKNDFTCRANCVGIFLYNSTRNDHFYNSIPLKAFYL